MSSAPPCVPDDIDTLAQHWLYRAVRKKGVERRAFFWLPAREGNRQVGGWFWADAVWPPARMSDEGWRYLAPLASPELVMHLLQQIDRLTAELENRHICNAECA